MVAGVTPASSCGPSSMIRGQGDDGASSMCSSSSELDDEEDGDGTISPVKTA